MNIHAVATVFCLAIALGAGDAAAQDQSPVARLINLQGNVLVSQGGAMVPATNDQRLTLGTRVQAGKDASVVVEYDVGCDVPLRQNESLTVGAGACCATASEATTGGTAVAQLTNLRGTVLVSKDDAMVAATDNQSVSVGTRVQTTADSGAVVDFADGCHVTLKENERFTVAKGPCCTRPGGVVALGPAAGAIGGGGVAAAGAIGGGVDAWAWLIPAAIAGVGLYEVYKSVSSD